MNFFSFKFFFFVLMIVFRFKFVEVISNGGNSYVVIGKVVFS